MVGSEQTVKNTYDARTRHESVAGRPLAAQNAALLIDFDNVTMGIRSDLQNQLRKLLNSEVIKGKVSVQRAYADWRRYPQYIAPLSESSIDLIFAPAFGSNKKNATDIRLAIDALELVFTRPEIGVFILLSGDSDFSSLVLKLKEYGKYVIGVGIRESASDLLIQNCDEYYSYSELTGLAKETESEVLPRDPWELVVEAVVRMQKDNDVMRSDRLKQVMQEIDPHFTEKDAGFNKFSKFVAEAGRRGLLTLERMEFGQFEVRPGPDANVPVAVPQTDAPQSGAATKQPPVVKRALAQTDLTLAEAFSLLKTAMRSLGAADGEPRRGEEVRQEMIEASGHKADPMLDGSRFRRVLRQAHDANIVDLAKDGDEYLVKLNPTVVAADDASISEPERGVDKGAKEERPSRGKRKRSATKKKATKSSAKSAARIEKSDDGKSDAAGRSHEHDDEPSVQKKPVVAQSSADATQTRPNPLYRAGSRKSPRRHGRASGSEARTEATEPSSEAPSSAATRTIQPPVSSQASQRSVRPRSGSRRRQPASAKEEDRGSETRTAPKVAPTPPPPPQSPPPSSASPRSPDQRDDDAPGLLKRMTTAFQRAVLGNDEEE